MTSKPITVFTEMHIVRFSSFSSKGAVLPLSYLHSTACLVGSWQVGRTGSTDIAQLPEACKKMLSVSTLAVTYEEEWPTAHVE